MPVGTSRCLDIIVYIAYRKLSGFQGRNLLLVAADPPLDRRVGSQQQSTPPLLQRSVPTRRGTHWYAQWQSRRSSEAPQNRQCVKGGMGGTYRPAALPCYPVPVHGGRQAGRARLTHCPCHGAGAPQCAPSPHSDCGGGVGWRPLWLMCVCGGGGGGIPTERALSLWGRGGGGSAGQTSRA